MYTDVAVVLNVHREFNVTIIIIIKYSSAAPSPSLHEKHLERHKQTYSDYHGNVSPPPPLPTHHCSADNHRRSDASSPRCPRRYIGSRSYVRSSRARAWHRSNGRQAACHRRGDSRTNRSRACCRRCECMWRRCC